MTVCALACVSVGAHTPWLMWKSEDNPECPSSPLAFFEAGLLICYSLLPCLGASLVFPPLPSRGTLGTQTVPLHLLLCGFWGLNAVQEVWVAKSLSAEAFPQPPQASFDNIIYLPGFWLSPCTLFSSTFSPQTTLSVWSPALGVRYSRPDRWWHMGTNLWREMVKPIWQIQKLRLTK